MLCGVCGCACGLEGLSVEVCGLCVCGAVGVCGDDVVVCVGGV